MSSTKPSSYDSEAIAMALNNLSQKPSLFDKFLSYSTPTGTSLLAPNPSTTPLMPFYPCLPAREICTLTSSAL
jgi:hypothetical protein